jgi:hypothetical protein
VVGINCYSVLKLFSTSVVRNFLFDIRYSGVAGLGDYMRFITILLTFLFFFTCLNGVVYGQNNISSQKIVLSAFDVSSAGKYAYLRDGVLSMLVSRLSAKEGVEFLDYKIDGKELTDLIKGTKEKGGVSVGVEADYLLTGTLFALTKGLNIQIAFYPLTEGEEVLHFSTVAESDDLIIAQVEQLSKDIAVKVFGHEELDSDTVDPEKELDGTGGFVTIHPEVAYKRGLYSGSVVGIGDSAIKVATRGVRRTGEVATEMIAMAVGDVDGDSKTEIVLLSERELRILQFVGRQLREVAKTKLPRSTKVHAINVADLDNNGKMEIYLSATKGISVASLIMEWDRTSGFVTVKKNIPWYLRPINHPERGWILAGQKRGVERIELVKKGVFQLSPMADNSFAAGGEIPLPRSVNLFDFSYADIDGDKSFETIAIDQNEKLRVYDQENGLLWVSSEDYGGSKTYIGPSQGDATDFQGSPDSFSVEERADQQIFFVPAKVVVIDLDKNGRQDIVVVNNVVASLSFFNKMRLYDGGSVVGLTWNGTALVETWRTGRQSGYIADFDFSLKNDMTAASDGEEGLVSLYIGQIPNSGTLEAMIPGSTRSKLTVFELGFSQKN